MTGPHLLSPGEAAKVLGKSRATIWRWCESDKLPAVKTPGGQYRIRRVDVEAAGKRVATK